MKSPKSQLAAMSAVSVDASKAAAMPVTQTGLFVRGDVKKGDAAHAFRLSIMRTAFLESLKRNPRNVAEIISESAGKSQVCAGYQAGIAAVTAMTRAMHPAETGFVPDTQVPLLQPFARDGKWNDPANADLRKVAETLADAALAAFAGAWTAGIDAHKAAKAAEKDKKAADKAAADAAAQAAKDAAAKASAGADAEMAAISAQGDLLEAAQEAAAVRAAALESTVDAIKHGLLSAADLQALIVAMEAAGVEFVSPVAVAEDGADAGSEADSEAVAEVAAVAI